MIYRKFIWVSYFVLLALAVPLQTHAYSDNNNDVLRKYVNLDDGMFSYQQVLSIPQSGFSVHVYKLTSQKWRSDSEVDRTIWEHRLTVVVPDNISSDTAILFIFGDKNNAGFLNPDPDIIQTLGTFAMLSGSVAAAVSQVPNQPLLFLDEPSTGRSEDSLVAYSWDTAMGSNDYTWAAYVPMTKSVVKAMDAVQAAANDLQLNVRPKKFTLVGFSKRGAITWLTAAVDDRVRAIAPGVFDTLHFAPSVENQRETYGKFAPSLRVYDERNVLDRFRTDEGRQLIETVDPFEYRGSIAIPKYIMNATGDEFYPPDSSLFYINQLPGETLLRYLPNTDHSGSNGGLENAIFGLLAWYQRIVLNVPRPTLNWKLDQASNHLSVTVSDPSATALLWSAHNPDARDFRLETFGPNWTATPLSFNPDGTLDAALQIPENGWTASFIQVTLNGIAGFPETYSTPVYILPDARPYTLDQPRNDPRQKDYWLDTLSSIVNGETENQALVESFPIRAISDVSIANIDDAYTLLAKSHPDRMSKAQQECLVTRLNIKDNRIDWYSHRNAYHSAYLWSLWNIANALYRARLYTLSEFVCATLIH